MAKTEPFDRNYHRYDRWFEENEALYESEIGAVKELLSGQGYGIEIGVGTGRFAKPLGIRVGVEPSIRMGQIAEVLMLLAASLKRSLSVTACSISR